MKPAFVELVRIGLEKSGIPISMEMRLFLEHRTELLVMRSKQLRETGQKKAGELEGGRDEG
jgi:hypothetical protein